MSALSPELQVRLIGVLAFVLIGYSAWMGMMTMEPLPGGYKNPVLALELVHNVQNLIRPQFYRAIPAGLLLGAVFTVGIAFLFTFTPSRVVGHLYPN